MAAPAITSCGFLPASAGALRPPRISARAQRASRRAPGRAGRRSVTSARATAAACVRLVGQTRNATSTSPRPGLTALRMTVDWARVEPEIGRFDDAALEPLPGDGGRAARARDRADGDAAPLRPSGVVRGPGRIRQPRSVALFLRFAPPCRRGARRPVLGVGHVQRAERLRDSDTCWATSRPAAGATRWARCACRRTWPARTPRRTA